MVLYNIKNMKNKVLGVLITLLLVSVASYAGNITIVSGDLSFFKNPSIRATVKFDYNDLILEGKPYMEQLKSRGDDFVKDWPSESTTSEAYFIKCWNKDNDEGMQITKSEGNEYLMYFHVKEMHMGSGAASMFVGFGAGGASMSGTMYIFKNLNSVPVLVVDIDNQTGRSGMTEIVRRTDLYGELAEDLVKTLKKSKQSKIKPSTKKVNLPNLELKSDTEITPELEANTKERISTDTITSPNKVSAFITNDNNETNAIVVSTINKEGDNSYEKAKSIPSTVINAKSNLSLDKKGEAGSIEDIVNEKRLSLYIDYSEALINNKSIDDFIDYMQTTVREKERDRDFKNNWENKHRNALALAFIDKANEELADKDLVLRLTTKQGCEYTLKIEVVEFDDDGNNICDYLILKTKTGEVISHYRLEAEGGKVGRYIGLLEQGHASAGEIFGKLLAKKIDKIID